MFKDKETVESLEERLDIVQELINNCANIKLDQYDRSTQKKLITYGESLECTARTIIKSIAATRDLIDVIDIFHRSALSLVGSCPELILHIMKDHNMQ